MNVSALETVAKALVADHRGILAADESTGTLKKRFDTIGLESTEEHRRAYRDMLFTTAGIGEYIGGVIMFDETIQQAAGDGLPFPRVLENTGVITGIKVDMGAKPMEESSEEFMTSGLDGLPDRLAAYYKFGARFAKWRAVITIGDGLPTRMCLEKNAGALASYARMCQEADIVPIVEPEVLMDADNSSERCFEVTAETIRSVFAALRDAHVVLSGMLLKPNMIVPGKKSGESMQKEKVAEMTVQCLREHVPAEVPGIVFLSGGQTEQEATMNLNAMNLQKGDAPWALSFSYGRALQNSALKRWNGKAENVAVAQEIFLKRARLNSLACRGEYSPEMEHDAAG